MNEDVTNENKGWVNQSYLLSTHKLSYFGIIMWLHLTATEKKAGKKSSEIFDRSLQQKHRFLHIHISQFNRDLYKKDLKYYMP